MVKIMAGKRVAEMTNKELNDLIIDKRFEDVIDAGYIWDNGLIPCVPAGAMFDIPCKDGTSQKYIDYIYSAHINALFDGCDTANGYPRMTYKPLDYNPLIPLHVEIANELANINGKLKRVYFGITFRKFHGTIN
jgi:hypothetical protein